MQQRGDVTVPLGEWIGERGSKRWIEGFGIAPPEGCAAEDIEYQAVLGRGWLSPWAEGGQYCGSRGMALPILGLRVRLRGAAAETHDVRLRASFVDGTEIGPVGDGAPCETEAWRRSRRSRWCSARKRRRRGRGAERGGRRERRRGAGQRRHGPPRRREAGGGRARKKK